MAGGRITTIILAVCAAALATGCGEETVDAADLESQIESDLTESAGAAPEAVQCPDTIPLSEGQDFECTVIAPNGDEVMFRGALTDDEGSFEGEVVGQ
jgi:hypothetical protein